MVMPHTIELKDLDSDGDIDILCSEFDTSNALSEVAWWQNNGNLNFSDKIVISEIFQQSTFVFADFIDSDDYMDVVACGELLDDVMWWQNDGNQNFGDGILIDPHFNCVHTIVGNDLDMDGDVDILGAACMGELLAWWENDGEGGFTRNDIDPFGGALWMDCADFDNDGDNDLFAVGQGPDAAYIYENMGDEVFEEYPLPGLFEDGFGATAKDFDNDGDTDLAAIGRSSHQICWWENQFYGVNFTVDHVTGNPPFTASFSDQSNFIEPVTTWSWDFENDGTFDAFEPNPTWIYEEPGTYSVFLEVLTEGEIRSILKEDYIQVFNGHSALEFTQFESHILHSAETSVNITEAFTIEAWIYPYSYGANSVFGWGRIFDKSAISLFLNTAFAVYPDNSLVMQMQHADGTLSSSTTPENSIPLNEWIHVAVSYDGIDQVRMFVNGDEMMSNQPTAPTGILEINADEDIYLGNLSDL
ncbi:MAG: VCBS repeat-containing protein, partial [Candidatus Delongbacteria bacterium]|nr:VCBS repeat-containing protein [Candidatus Delongbacteria bacterium]